MPRTKTGRNSEAFKHQMHVGAAIADQLPKRTTLRQTAKVLGLSTVAVRRIECLALYKLQMRLKELLAIENS